MGHYCSRTDGCAEQFGPSLPGLEEYQLGQYPEELGEGQFSKVYKCQRRGCPDEHFALKVFTAGPEGTAHGSTEIRALRALGAHPHIMGLVDLDVGDPSEQVKLVLDICWGGQLYDRIEQKGGYEEDSAAVVVRQVLEAVSFMHSRGVIHRDLKPENVLLTCQESDEDVKVCDFGIAKIAKGRGGAPRAHTFTGSDHYLAPEVIQQREYGCEVDIWAVGVLCWVLLTATLPFAGEGEGEEARLSTYRKIVDRQLDFTAPAWQGKTEFAADFVDRLLTVHQRLRPTAITALRHRWQRSE